MKGPDPRGIYFNSRYFGEPDYNYVCWLDVMGSANQMLRSLPIAANFVFKLHCAVLEAADDLVSREGLYLYPVMDGVYITSQRRIPLQSLLNQALRRIIFTFMNEATPHHQFLVRGAIAFGPVYHGYALAPETTRVLEAHDRIRDSILLGLPMAQAYASEREAPPFGIAAHSSARAFAPEGDRPFRFIWLDWFHGCTPPVDVPELLEKMNTYFKWQADHCNMTGYEPNRIDHHRKLAEEYFTASARDEESSVPCSAEAPAAAPPETQ